MDQHMTDKIREVLEGKYHDPETGQAMSVPIGCVAIERDLRGMEADLVRGLGFGRSLAIVSDQNTHKAMGQRVESALASFATITSVVLPHGTHPDLETVERVTAESTTADALIAVGSGTINDLCKCSSARQRKPYAVFATAPSMNGYTSVNAAITVDGLKKTLPAQGASGVFMDVQILANSPMRLILSGYGDSICRSTAQADWLLSHKVCGTEYREAPYDLLYEAEAALFAEPSAIAARDPVAVEYLARLLTLSGLGMTICGGSAPASQGEHMISHFIDMLPPSGWRGAYHGEQVAVTTVTSAAIQEAILNLPAPTLSESKTTRAMIDNVFGKNLGQLCWEQYEPKQLRRENVDAINDRLHSAWPELRDHAQTQSWSSQRIRDTLKAAGAPTTPEDIGLSSEYYRTAVMFARTIRNRFSFLDIACDLDGIRIAEFVDL